MSCYRMLLIPPDSSLRREEEGCIRKRSVYFGRRFHILKLYAVRLVPTYPTGSTRTCHYPYGYLFGYGWDLLVAGYLDPGCRVPGLDRVPGYPMIYVSRRDMSRHTSLNLLNDIIEGCQSTHTHTSRDFSEEYGTEDT